MRVILAAVAVCALCLPTRASSAELTHAAERETSQQDLDVLFRKWAYASAFRLREVPFLLEGNELRLGNLGLGMPMEAFERLFLGQGGTISEVHRPAQLVGHVRITSPEAALQYVRLFTSPATVWAVGGPYLEVLPERAVTPQLVFGRPEYLRAVWRLSWGSFRDFGVLSDAEWARAGLTAPAVLPVQDGFIVIRPLFALADPGRGNWWTDQVQWVAETVSPNGEVKQQVLGHLSLTDVRVGLSPVK